MNGALDLGTSFAEGKDEDSLPAVSPTRYERLELIGSGAFGEVYRGYVPKPLSSLHGTGQCQSELCKIMFSLAGLRELPGCCRWDREEGLEVAIKVIDLEIVYVLLSISLTSALPSQTQ